MFVDLNINRLQYLLSLYKMEDVDLLNVINKDRKRKITRDQVFTSQIDIRILNKIDTLLFDKGIPFYVDPEPIVASESMSVFFRKKSFREDLNLTSKQIVNNYESLKNYLSSLDALSNIRTEVNIPHFTLSTNPKVAARKVRAIIYPQKKYDKPRDFLKALIENLAEAGVIVFEYLEAPNKSEKANIDGFYLRPDFIVLKRYSYYKREIFTLLHELGHCVLNEEEVESLDVMALDYSSMSKIEKWCNDFSYYFLVGEDSESIDNIIVADGTNDYQFPIIEHLSDKCFISKRALFTRLYYSRKITQTDYQNVIQDLDERFRLMKERQKSMATKEDGSKRRMSPPIPIYSPKFLSTLSIALNDGVVRPADLYKMKIPAKVVEGLKSWL